MAMDFSLILSNSKSNGLLTNSDSESSILSSDNLTSTSILSDTNEGCCMDAFSGKDMFGTVDLDNMNESLFANNTEAAGSIAMDGAEAAGSIAMGGVETAGSVAMGGSEAAGSVACDSGGGFSSVC